jgi:hypothetical protein
MYYRALLPAMFGNRKFLVVGEGIWLSHSNMDAGVAQR